MLKQFKPMKRWTLGHLHRSLHYLSEQTPKNITGVSEVGLEYTIYDRSRFKSGRGIIHALTVQSNIRVKSNSFDDYVLVFNFYRELKSKYSKLHILSRILKVYHLDHKLPIPKQKLYSHFGNMDMNPFPFKNEFRQYTKIRKIHYYIGGWSKERLEGLLDISELAAKREADRTHYKITNLRDGKSFNLITTFTSIFLAYLAISPKTSSDVDISGIFVKFLKRLEVPGGFDPLWANIFTCIAIWFAIRFVFIAYSTIRIFWLSRHLGEIELLDFAIRMAASSRLPRTFELKQVSQRDSFTN
ncbi:hypothetical protein [Roseibium sediminicola]|uniref:Uncharacterized protein n=1 Tax=Roseibium sediminicola TaxID=2933272 RepID=A0ABT0GSE4_9HYPH|nr:hypothetical protein [Roseibium sp. CAU 1639]MCK7612365.1 hypothetical protein [Roseibium sp. CAU 1639]